MNKELSTTSSNKEIVIWDEEQKKLLQNTVAKGLLEQEFIFFAEVCKATGLNPLLRQIHCTVHKDQYGNRNLTIITGIDGIRKIAHSTGKYAGRDKAKFIFKEDGVTPKEVEVTVYKIVQGIRCAFTATACWDEYLPSQPKKRFMWNKMKQWMIEKCCEAKALRMAFTQELSGIFEEGESHQIGDKANTDEGKDMNNLIKGLPDEIRADDAKPEVKKDVEHEEKVELGEPEREVKEEAPAEDIPELDKSEEPENKVPITAKQRQRLFAISRTKGWKDNQVKEAMFSLTGVKSTKELTAEPYEFLVGFIQKNGPEALHADQ